MTDKKVTSNERHVDLEANISRDDQPMKQFKPGDIAWIKTPNFCWWPGQVVDEGSVRFRPKKKVKDGVLVRMYGCYKYLYVDPEKCNTEFENILKKENLSIREAFQKAMDEDISCVRSRGKAKRKVSESRGGPKGKQHKRDNMDRTETVDNPPHPAASSGEAEEGSALEKQKDEPKVRATSKKLKCDEATNPRVYRTTRSRASNDHSTEGAQKPKVTEMVSHGASKVKETPNVASGTTKRKDVTEKTKIGTPKGKILKQQDVDSTQTKSPCTTKSSAPEELTPNLSERRMRVMQSLGLIAPLGSPYRRNGFVITAALQ